MCNVINFMFYVFVCKVVFEYCICFWEKFFNFIYGFCFISIDIFGIGFVCYLFFNINGSGFVFFFVSYEIGRLYGLEWVGIFEE